MCDKDLLIDYLYGELATTEREAFDRHLASCAECRDEVAGLRGARTHLESWMPPEPELGFQIVRGIGRPVTMSRRWWGLSPAWGLAAAAMLIGAVSAAIANVEVTAASNGITVRTGWNRAAAPVAATVSAETAADVQRLDAKIRDLEAKIAKEPPAIVATSAADGVHINSRMSDAELLRTVRRFIDQSEQRMQSTFANQVLQVNRDYEVARRSDIDQIGRRMDQIQRSTLDTYQRTKTLEDYVTLRVGLQR
jgi:BMFP domain-containing protein YqiC